MIKESSLPQRSAELWNCSSRHPRRLSLQRRSNCPLQPTHPKPRIEVLASAHKEMHVVGHDDVASYRNAMLSISTFCICPQCLMGRFAGEHTSATKSAERHKINRVTVGIKYRGQSRRLAWIRRLHTL